MKMLNQSVLGFFCLVLLTGCGTGCAGLNARQKVLLPTLQMTWEPIREAASRGAGLLPPESIPVAADTLGAFERALTAGTSEGIAHVYSSWVSIRAWAEAGIEDRVTAGEISAGVAGSLKERVRQFHDALGQFLHSEGSK